MFELNTEYITAYDNTKNKDVSDAIISRFKNLKLSNVNQVRFQISSLENLKAKKFVSSFDIIAEHGQEMKIFQEFEMGNFFVCNPLKKRKSGKIVPNFYEMDSFVVQALLDHGNFELPFRNTNSLARGCANSIREIRDYIGTIGTKNYSMYRPFVPGNYIVRVQESTDWELFNNLVHVGSWGKEVNNRPYFSEMNLKKKVMTVAPKTAYQKSFYGDNRAPFIPYDALVSGKHWNQSKVSEEQADYVNSMIQYQENNKSFFFFEILLVNCL